MEWKRINFFKGFFTHAEDWQAAETYRSIKHRLHNQAMHGWGIVPNYLNSLEVGVSSDGITITVAPGLAIDRNGREMLLSDPQSVRIELQAYPADTHVYLMIRYEEEPIDRRENVANPQYSGHAFIREFARLELSPNETRGGNEVEIARVRIGPNATRLRMPADPAAPQHNELDLRHRHYAGVARAHLRLHEFAELVAEGTINVTAGEHSNVGIQQTKREEAHHFYVASCRPLGDANIAWKITANHTREVIEYLLDIENLSRDDVEVNYRVFRLG
jgi:hypothetical protein